MTYRDGRVQGAVAHLVEHDVVRSVAECSPHGQAVTAVHADTLHALPERIRRIAAGRNRDLVPGHDEALHQQFAEKSRPADHQNILVHVFSLMNRVYFLLSSRILQTRKNQGNE
jgi:hypothetical protein